MDTNTLSWLLNHIKRDDMIPFYKSRPWRSLRKQALERDNYECQVCKRYGRYRLARNVHHLKEVKVRPDLALTLDNLESVCIQCHNEIHDKRLKVDKRKPFINKERW